MNVSTNKKLNLRFVFSASSRFRASALNFSDFGYLWLNISTQRRGDAKTQRGQNTSSGVRKWLFAFFSRLFYLFGLIFTLFCICLEASPPIPTEKRLKVLYNSLDPNSIAQHLAFYELYGDKPIGQQALGDACKLLAGPGTKPQNAFSELSMLPTSIMPLVMLVNKPIDQSPPDLTEENLRLIERFAERLPHTKLKGHAATTEEETFPLPPEEIDLARGLFLSQFGKDLSKIRLYEAMIDLMALQILTHLSPQASPQEKVQAINHFIFEEMHFRFPPHSIYAKDIDLYTFLPSVLDSHRGVCLGVSILYLCIAQRLGLTLEMITPPGHIYIRYHGPNEVINIETTARGVHIDSEEYLSIDTRSLQQRNIKEVIGLAHMNQAAVLWQREQYDQAVASYLKAEPYLPNDNHIKELLGYTCLFNGQEQKGRELLALVKDDLPDHAVTKGTVAEDFLNGQADAESIKAIYKSVDESRASIWAKKQSLEDVLKRFPRFRGAILQLGVAWIQLHRMDHALEVLNYYHSIDDEDPEVNYYLAILSAQRMDYNKAWEHLRQAEKIVQTRQYNPKVLIDLRKSLAECCPEYIH